MYEFPHKIIDELKVNTLTRLCLSIATNFEGLLFNEIQISVPKKQLNKIKKDGENNVFSSKSLFSDKAFSMLKDALILNTSLTQFKEEACSVFTEEQYLHIFAIAKRNKEIKKNKITLLHYAASNGNFEVIQAFVWQRKELKKDLETAIEYAQDNNHLLIAEFLQCQNQPTVQLIDKPLSEKNKLYIFNSLKSCSNLKADFKQMLIAAALAGVDFPPQLKQKLAPLQSAYLANKDSPQVGPVLEQAITLYFGEEGLRSFKDLLYKPFNESDWSYKLMRTLAKDNIIIKKDPYVLATIKNGKIYWCVVFGDNNIKYRKDDEHYKKVITDARENEGTWQLTWDEFRKFKDAGKRTGTVSVTKERFVENYKSGKKEKRKAIWEQLCDVGILDEKLRLSQEWYPFSGPVIELQDMEIKPTDRYQKIADALEKITKTPEYAETFADEMVIFREALIAKRCYSKGGVENKYPKSERLVTKIWQVGSYRELRDHIVPQEPPCEIDHIPSQSQIKTLCDDKIQQIDENIKKLKKGSSKKEQYQVDREELNIAKNDLLKLSCWCIYIDKKLHKTGDTNGTSKEKQKELTLYSSIHTHIDNLKKMDGLSMDTLLTALGAFRYLYSRLCKETSHIEHKNINTEHMITNACFQFFGQATEESDREMMDDLFIEEMKSFQNTKFNMASPK